MKRILVAEDSPTQAEHLRAILEAEGFEVACVADARAALARIADEPFDLVLSDVTMPGVLNGVGLLRALRADPATEAVPVMLVSAHAEEEARVEGLAAGADDYIVKPFGGRELLARVDAAIRLARLRRQVATREKELETARAQVKLSLAMDAAKMGEVICNLSTGAIIHTPAFAALLGYESGQSLSLSEIRERYHPESLDDVLAIRTAQSGPAEHFEVEHRVIWPDGAGHWLAGRGHVARDASGAPVEITTVYMDVTERKLAEERQRLLLEELNHRVKNTLATVLSISMQTRRNATTLESFCDAFEGRIAALAGAHDLLTLNAWEGATLGEVLDRTLAPYAADDDDGEERIVSAGPLIRLGPNAAVTLNMAFHELATNAAKYGALSAGKGHLDVRWSVDRSVSPATVEIDWTERGGPQVQRPLKQGFGSRLVEKGLSRELNGEVRVNYDRDGLSCQIRLPESAKVSPA
jgi:two-component sensor histidine kinase/DNA-binding response OmpR family regulator